MQKNSIIILTIILIVSLVSCEIEVTNIKSFESIILNDGKGILVDKDELIEGAIKLGQGSLSDLEDILYKVNYKYIKSKPFDDHYDVLYFFYEIEGEIFMEEQLIDSNTDYTEIFLSDISEVVIALSDYYFDYDWYVEETVNIDDSFIKITQNLSREDKNIVGGLACKESEMIVGGLPYKENLIKIKKKFPSNNGVHLEYKSNREGKTIFNVIVKLE